MEGDSHSVIEGMAIAGYAIGAHQGYVYIRAEYPLAVKPPADRARTRRAASACSARTSWGSGFDFDIDIKLGAGAFVCGEETALIHSIEGERGEPRTKPPFPAASRPVGQAHHRQQRRDAGQRARDHDARGRLVQQPSAPQTSKGTKVFALAGQINNVGLVEVPMGTTLREIIYDIGGGIRGGLEFKAAQTGGPSGGCIPKQFLDTPDRLRIAGARSARSWAPAA